MKHARWALALAAALVLPLTTCAASAGAEPTAPAELTAMGTVSAPAYISLENAGRTDDECVTDVGYEDISTGAQVVVTDADGKTVGVGHLSAGTSDMSSVSLHCVFGLSVEGIVPGSKFYGFHVGNTNRGTVQETPDQLHDIELTIGH